LYDLTYADGLGQPREIRDHDVDAGRAHCIEQRRMLAAVDVVDRVGHE
jgi:hypothetical protein